MLCLISCTQHVVHSGEHLTLACHDNLEHVVGAAAGVDFICFVLTRLHMLIAARVGSAEDTAQRAGHSITSTHRQWTPMH